MLGPYLSVPGNTTRSVGVSVVTHLWVRREREEMRRRLSNAYGPRAPTRAAREQDPYGPRLELGRCIPRSIPNELSAEVYGSTSG